MIDIGISSTFLVFLILSSVFLHYGLGRRLGVSGVLTASLVGVAASGLVVACLANFCAGLIRPFLWLDIVGNAVLTASYLRKVRWDTQRAKIYSLLFLLIALLTYLNLPQREFLVRGQGDQINLKYDPHFSYYGLQSIEMLRADYYSRLRVSNFYPHEWGRYHFFNAATETVVQFLVKQPGLISYWFAQILLSILVLISFAELFFDPKKPMRGMLRYGFWLLLGLSLFRTSLLFNLATTGIFSVFFLVHFLWALFRGEKERSFLFLVAVGVSAFRLNVPMALGILAFAYVFRERLDWRKSLAELKKNPWVATAVVLAALYNLLILVSPPNLESKAISSLLFFDAWLAPLLSYQVIGFLFTPVKNMLGRDSDRFGFYNHYDAFSRIPSSVAISGVVIVLALAGLWLARKKLVKFAPSRVQARGLMGVAFLMLAAVVLYSRELFFVYLISIPYFVVTWVLARLALGSAKKSLVWVVLAMQVGGLLFSHLGTGALQAPVLFVVYDLVLWGILGVIVASRELDANQIGIGAGILAVSFFLFPLRFHRLMVSPQTTMTLINVTPFIARGMDRSFYVDKDGMLKHEWGVPEQDDTYSVVLGARLPYREDNKSLFNYRFVAR